MYLEKKIQIEFTEKEKEVINNFIELKRACRRENMCEYMECDCCPFDSICSTNSINNGEEMEEHINENLE